MGSNVEKVPLKVCYETYKNLRNVVRLLLELLPIKHSPLFLTKMEIAYYWTHMYILKKGETFEEACKKKNAGHRPRVCDMIDYIFDSHLQQIRADKNMGRWCTSSQKTCQNTSNSDLQRTRNTCRKSSEILQKKVLE